MFRRRCRAVFGAIFTNSSKHRYVAPRFRETPQIFIAAEWLKFGALDPS